MGRKRSLHPSDILRKKQRRKELRKLQKQRQQARNEGLRRLAPEKLVNQMKKLARQKNNEGSLDERNQVRLRNLQNAYKDVMNSRKTQELEKKKKESKYNIAGMDKLLVILNEGGEKKETVESGSKGLNDDSLTDKEKEALKEEKNKENITDIEDLEFPPGLPRPVHLCPPPGIRPRLQKVDRPRTKVAKSDGQHAARVLQAVQQPRVQILKPNNSFNSRKRKRDMVPEDFYDPMNPENPFFSQHPKKQAHLQQEVRKLEKQQRRMKRQEQRRQGQASSAAVGLQPGPGGPVPGLTMQPNNFGPAPMPLVTQQKDSFGPAPPAAAIQNMEFGPLPPTQDAANDDLPALPEYSEEGKLEILLPETYMALRPSATRVRRQTRKKKKQTLDLAPEIGVSQKPKKKKGKKKTGKHPQSGDLEYDSFMAEIQALM